MTLKRLCDILFSVPEEKMDIPERRQVTRLKVNLPVTFQRMGMVKSYGETITKDISSTGLRINLEEFSPSQENFLIRLSFPEVSKIIEGMARTVWSGPVAYSDKYQAGLEFYEMNPMYKKWLEEYIQIHQTYSK